MPSASKLPESHQPQQRSPWQDIRLDDCRRPEDQPPDQITTFPPGRPGLDLLFLAVAVIALVIGLHFVAPAPVSLKGNDTAGQSPPAHESQASRSR